MTWSARVAAETAEIQAAGRWRQLRVLDGGGPEFRVAGDEAGESQVVSFASNDYLGLSRHPAVVAAARDALDRWGAGAGSSRLIVGTRPIHADLEAALARWRGTARALVFPTGYQANVAALTTFGAGARIVSDELNHASLIDGARLARAEVAVYRHGDVAHAEQLVRDAPGPAVVVTDSVFSMDGDVAPVAALSEMCARHQALLILDDAHACFDIPAPDPAAECLRVGTLSKALGSQGGYLAGPRSWIELLINRARSFIFTTAVAPASAAAALAAVAICTSDEGATRRAILRRHVDTLRPGYPSPIIPVVRGEESAALAAAERLLLAGLLVPAIRPPTVPPGTSRLRVSLSAAHTDGDVRRLALALGGLD
jgi:8-amino-7-oxononanoate synthase